MKVVVHKDSLMAALSLLGVVLGAAGLWDGWMNHRRQPTYCFPFCLGGNVPNYVAGDVLLTVVVVSALVITLVHISRDSVVIG